MTGIVFIGDLKYCPYLSKYTQVLDEKQEKYEILFWNREGVSKKYPSNYISFNEKSVLNRHPMFKIGDFFKFKSWVNKQIAVRKYDKLIVLSTLSGILIARTLIKKYAGKYIFDIRDYSYEKNKLFYRIEEKLIKKSFFTCISSKGFKEFLPNDYSYKIAHNFNQNELKFENRLKKKDKGSVLNLVWLGAVRYFDYQSEIINRLKNDRRFNMIYHGSGPDLEKFRKYCEDNEINNICFTGAYDNSIKASLLEGADILNNSYGTKNDNKVKYAISNKYYDNLVYGIPQLVELNSFKHKKVSELGTGIGLDVYGEDFADKLYNYYFNINEEQFNRNCKSELEEILEEDELYLKSIRDFINS